MNGLLRLIIVESTVMLAILIWVVYSIVKRQELFPAIAEGKEDIVAKVLVLAVVAIIVAYEIVPQCMDLSYYYNNEFCYMEGVAQSRSDRSAARGGHTVYIKDGDSGEEIYVCFHYKGTVEQGDRLKIKYLPNSKRAILLEINGKKPSEE